MKKKFFALMLTLCMVLTMMPSMAWADGNGDDDGPKYIDVLAVMYDDGPKALGDAQPYITKFGVDTGIMLMTGVKQEESGLISDEAPITYKEIEGGCLLREFDGFTIEVYKDGVSDAICKLTGDGEAQSSVYPIRIKVQNNLKRSDEDPIYNFILRVGNAKNSEEGTAGNRVDATGLYTINVKCVDNDNKENNFDTSMQFYVSEGTQNDVIIEGNGWALTRDWNASLTNLGFYNEYDGRASNDVIEAMRKYGNTVDNLIIAPEAKNIPCAELNAKLGILKSIDIIKDNGNVSEVYGCNEKGLYEIGKPEAILIAIKNNRNDDGERWPQWRMIFTDKPIDNVNPPQKIQEGVYDWLEISGASNSREGYLYLVQMKNREGDLDAGTIRTLTTENFNIKYILNEGDLEGEGVRIVRIKENTEENHYRIMTDSSQQSDYDKGTKRYDVWPILPEDDPQHENVFNFAIQTGESTPKNLVFSTRADLDTLTQAQIMNTNDFGIMEQPTLGAADASYTGYFYLADMEFVNNHWVYQNFAKLTDSEKPYISFYAGKENDREKWITSKENPNSIKALKLNKNNDGTYTIQYKFNEADSIVADGGGFKGYFIGACAIDENGNWMEDIADGKVCIGLLYKEIAPVDRDARYTISFEMLQDPSEYVANGYTGPTDRMWVNGQGTGMQFNTLMNKWETCFYVVNESTGRDARFVVDGESDEARTYIGEADDFVIQAREINGDNWRNQSELDDKYQIYSIKYVGYKKGFSPVFEIALDNSKNKTGDEEGEKVTDKYQYRLKYAGNDPYLKNGNEENSFYLDLTYDETLREYVIDESRYNEKTGEYEAGNIQYFDYVGATIKTKINLRPDVAYDVAYKNPSDKRKFIYIENDATNIKFYHYGENDNLVELQENEIPFTIVWNADKKWYEITYSDPQKDLSGPWYTMKYTGDYNALINTTLGLPEGTTHDVGGESGFFTGKMTLKTSTVNEDGVVDAKTDDNIKATEVIFEKDAIKGQQEIKISTNDGHVTIGGSLVTNMKSQETETSFEMRNVKEDAYGLTTAQATSVKDAELAFDFTIAAKDSQNSKIDFGTDGYATVEIPCKTEGMAVYFVDDNGNKELVKDYHYDEKGNIVFTATHFSTYIVAKKESTSGDNTGGGTSGGSSGGGGGFVTPAATPLDKAKTEAKTAISAAASANKYDDAEQAEVKAILDKAAADIKNAKTEDEVKAIREAAQAEIDKVLTTEEKAQIKAVASVDKEIFKAKSRYFKLKGKRAIKLTWNIPDGMKFDGFEIYRSTKKFSGYGKTPYFTTTKTSYINSKDLVKGKTYYYKVRAFVIINGEKFYTDYSTKAFRTMK